MIFKEALEVGVEYSVKLQWKKRKARFIYEGVELRNTGEIDSIECYHLHGQGTNLWVTDEHIESIEIATPLKPKQKKNVTCTRCLGNKVYEKFSHINGGKCFKCEGTGII